MAVKRGRVRIFKGRELSGAPVFIYTCPYCGHENERRTFTIIIACSKCGRVFHVA